MKQRRVIFSGGGTAGHLFPALAVGRNLLQREPDVRLTFVGGTRTLEQSLMSRQAADFIPLRIEGLRGRGLKAVRALFLIPSAFLKSFFLLRKLRPSLSVGVGGFSSGPVVLLSSWMGIPSLVMEQNSRPGFTNRLLSRWIDRAVVAYESALPFFGGKGVLIGNPVREEFNVIGPRTGDERRCLLVFGGSQGSRFLNHGVTDALPLLAREKPSLSIRHQTGERDYGWVKDRYAAAGFTDAVVEPFFFDMPRLFAEADLVVSRAGATTIAELVAARRASLLIPFAQAAENHQLLNARQLEAEGGTEVMIEEEFSSSAFAAAVLGLIRDEMKLARMERNLERLKPDRVVERIADLCFQLMDSKTRRN